MLFSQLKKYRKLPSVRQNSRELGLLSDNAPFENIANDLYNNNSVSGLAIQEVIASALNGSSIFIFTMDYQLRYTKVYNSDILFGSRNITGLTDFELFLPEDAARLTKCKMSVLKTGGIVKCEDFYNLDTGTFYLSVKLEPIIAKDNSVDGIIGTIVDMTKEKLSEDKLTKTIKALDRYTRELEQLSYVASHDLQEPLRAIGSFTQLLELRYKDKLDENASKYIHYAVDGVNRMQNLINCLLEYTRISRHNKPFETCDCNAILQTVLNELRNDIEQTGAVIRTDNLPVIYSNENQIQQLLENLIQNAIKFTKDKTPQIEIKCEQLEFEWLFSISDNGPGIEKEYHQKIFTIFQRLNDRDEYEGAGIGLALCKKIVEHHGGQIWVDSSPGEGSIFYFTIPFRGE